MRRKLIPVPSTLTYPAPVLPDQGGFARHRAAGRDAVFRAVVAGGAAGRVFSPPGRTGRSGESLGEANHKRTARGVRAGPARRRIDFDTRHRHSARGFRLRAARTPRIPFGCESAKPRRRGLDGAFGVRIKPAATERSWTRNRIGPGRIEPKDLRVKRTDGAIPRVVVPMGSDVDKPPGDRPDAPRLYNPTLPSTGRRLCMVKEVFHVNHFGRPGADADSNSLRKS